MRKSLKIVFISFTLLLLCSMGVAAQATYNSAPTNYVNANGTIGTVPAGTVVTPIGNMQKNNSQYSLTGGTPGGSPTWYWAGQDSTDKAASATINNNLTFLVGEGSATATSPSVINIIIGYNGGPGVPSMKVSSTETSTIPSGVQVNFYAAAISATEAADYDQCHVQFINTQNTTAAGDGTKAQETTSAGPGLTVQGELNVYSGGVEGFSNPTTGTATEGLLVSGGKINVLGGELEGNTNTNDAYTADADGISITSGTNNGTTTNGNITVNGGMLLSMQGYKPGTPENSTAVSRTAGVTTTSTTGTLTVNNGTVYSNVPVTDATTTNGITFSNGVWITGDSAGNKVGTVTGTSAVLATGVYDSMLFNGTGSSLTVPTTANLTIPAATTAEGIENAPGATFINGAQLNIQGSVTVNSSNGLWFDTDSEGGTDITQSGFNNNGGSTLTIGSTSNLNAQLTIGPNGNVTLGVGTQLPSQLQNYGTITVEEPQDSQS